MVDYSKNFRIDCIPPHISLPLINQIKSLHILRHFQISRPISLFLHWLSSVMNALPSIFCLSGGCFASLYVHYFVRILLYFCFWPCLLFNPSLLEAPPVPCHSHQYLHSHDFYFGPIIPLGHQPGSLLHQQCHPFLCKSWCLHTKLPICTLPALRCLHGSSGPEEHAPAAWGSSALRCPARPLPAGAHRLPPWLPR